MATIRFWEKAGCLNNTKQKALLVEAGHTLDARDILREEWTPKRLRPFFSGLVVADWFNPAAPRIRSGEVTVDALSEEQALVLMCEDPLLIRRPLMEADGEYFVGFEMKKVEAWLGSPLGESSRGPSLETCPKEARRTRRVALASRDGKVVHQHFGRATHFVIVDLRDKKVEFVEHRPNTPVCTGGEGEHADDTMRRCIDGLSDCQVVVSSRIGPGAVEKLNERGIRAYLSRVEIAKTLKLLSEDNLLTAEEFFRTRHPE